jgi:peptidyl-prolyl cis-trans isomerase C
MAARMEEFLKKTTIGAAWILCGSLACGRGEKEASSIVTASPSPPPEAYRPLPDPLPNVAASVNGQPIWIRLVTLYVQKTRPKEVFSVEEKAKVYREALDRCIDRELLFQEALARGLSPSDHDVQETYDEARVKQPDDAGWAKFLEAQHLTPDGFKAEIRTEKTITLLLRQEGAKVPPVTEVETRAYFDQHPSVFETGERIRARTIVITNALMGPDARQKLSQRLLPVLMQRLKDGEDFVSVARRADTDHTWETAGQSTIFRRSELPEVVAARAFALKPGETTGFVSTPKGFELVKVEEKLPSERLTYEQAAPRLNQLLAAERYQNAMQKYADGLHAKARVEKFL